MELLDSSGKEGSYPDLEQCAEKQLASVDPGKYVELSASVCVAFMLINTSVFLNLNSALVHLLVRALLFFYSQSHYKSSLWLISELRSWAMLSVIVA